VTWVQKSILAGLALISVGVLAAFAVVFGLLLMQRPAATPPPANAAPIAAVPPTAAVTRTATPAATATLLPQPTPTATRVVNVTVLPSPSATVANCAATVINFKDSGALTDDQVRQYLQQVIPPEHLDGCRGIEYVPRLAQMNGGQIAGNIIPVYNTIYVYAVEPPYLTANYLLDTLVHEIGHNRKRNMLAQDVANEKTNPGEPPKLNRWSELYRQSKQARSGFVSDYAGTSQEEDFAESYRIYVREPNLLRLVNPAKYEFMRDQVFNGREYQAP